LCSVFDIVGYTTMYNTTRFKNSDYPFRIFKILLMLFGTPINTN